MRAGGLERGGEGRCDSSARAQRQRRGGTAALSFYVCACVLKRSLLLRGGRVRASDGLEGVWKAAGGWRRLRGAEGGAGGRERERGEGGRSGWDFWACGFLLCVCLSSLYLSRVAALAEAEPFLAYACVCVCVCGSRVRQPARAFDQRAPRGPGRERRNGEWGWGESTGVWGGQRQNSSGLCLCFFFLRPIRRERKGAYALGCVCVRAAGAESGRRR